MGEQKEWWSHHVDHVRQTPGFGLLTGWLTTGWGRFGLGAGFSLGGRRRHRFVAWEIRFFFLRCFPQPFGQGFFSLPFSCEPWLIRITNLDIVFTPSHLLFLIGAICGTHGCGLQEQVMQFSIVAKEQFYGIILFLTR